MGGGQMIGGGANEADGATLTMAVSKKFLRSVG